MRCIVTVVLCFLLLDTANCAVSSLSKKVALQTIDVGYTVQKVRTARCDGESYIVAATYEGKILGVSYSGEVLWENPLSGYMVHDIWCSDLNGDGNDEILIANADGSTYCLSGAENGKLKWQFYENDVPMYAVTTVQKDGKSYVVCGGFDLTLIYLSSEGKKVKEIASSTYSKEKVWGLPTKEYSGLHYTNFLRTLKLSDGSDLLLVHGSNNHMQGKGSIYLFDPLSDSYRQRVPVKSATVIGDLYVCDSDLDGVNEIVLGTSGHKKDASFIKIDLKDNSIVNYKHSDLKFAYLVTQTRLIKDIDQPKYLSLAGSNLFLVDLDMKSRSERVESKYSFYDLWQDGDRVIMASEQSGGSTISIYNTTVKGWKSEFQNFKPQGKLKQIIDNPAKIRADLASYRASDWQREPRSVYFMTSDIKSGTAKEVADMIKESYSSPIFLGSGHSSKAENWDRSKVENDKYRKKRDRRKKYELTSDRSVDMISKWYDGYPGVAYWGGHGNDPYMYSLNTTKKVIDKADGKKTVLIYPELEDETDDFEWVMNDLFYPLADYCGKRDGNIYVRCKHNFWQGNIYLPMWKPVLDGKYADVFVPSMEETTDKAMDISLASRVGLWAAGSFNSWGTRAVPDNPSFDRSRQFSSQMVPNHFLRHIILHIAYGATYINNFNVDPDYMSLIWELIAKGALYVPKREEIVSFSPVHLSMKEPSEEFMEEAGNVKWSIFYDKANDNKASLFSRQNGTWPAAKVTEWDFSRYAAGVKDRRQNYLPPYPNGLVLITPPQEGIYASKEAVRKDLTSYLHPLYRDIMTEYITDGESYFTADGLRSMDADQYYKEVEKKIEDGAKLLPLTVTGDVAWVAAQTSPTTLRLTVVDGGYLNPSDKIATIHFNSVTPISIVDILDRRSYSVKREIDLDIPAGAFRFIDIELSERL